MATSRPVSPRPCSFSDRDPTALGEGMAWQCGVCRAYESKDTRFCPTCGEDFDPRNKGGRNTGVFERLFAWWHRLTYARK